MTMISAESGAGHTANLKPDTSLAIARCSLLVGLAIVSAGSNIVASCHADPPITDVVFSPDGKFVLTCSQAGLRILNWPRLSLNRAIELPMDNVHALAFSPSGNAIAVAGGTPSETGQAQIYSWPELKQLSVIVAAEDSFSSIQWIGENQLLGGSLDGSLVIWPLNSPGNEQSLIGHSKPISSVAVLKEGTIGVSTGYDQSVRVWELKTRTLIRSLNQHTKPVKSLAVSPLGEGLPMLASASEDRTVRFWQPTIGRMVRTARVDAVPNRVVWVDFDHVAVACSDGSVRKIHSQTLTQLKSSEVLDGWAYGLAVHPEDGTLIVAGEAGMVRKVTFEQQSETANQSGQ